LKTKYGHGLVFAQTGKKGYKAYHRVVPDACQAVGIRVLEYAVAMGWVPLREFLMSSFRG
jgi:hypothetical protein